MKRVLFSAASFDTPLVIRRDVAAVQRDGARVEAVLVEDYRISFVWEAERWALTVPAGFPAAPSVPPALHGLVPFWGALLEASFVHDYAYETGCFDPYGQGRKCADRLLRALMLAGGTSEHDANEVYAAVRIFGSGHYRPKAGTVNGLHRVA